MKRAEYLSLILVCIIISIACSISFGGSEEDNLQATVDALQGSSSGQSGSSDPNCNSIIGVSDASIPDGTKVNPGEAITKTWQMTNGGTCIWNSNYSVAMVSDLDHSIIEMYPLNQSVSPGASAQVSVPLHVPIESGEHTFYYMLVDESRQTFGFGVGAQQPFWANIIVTDDGSSQVAKGDDQAGDEGEEEKPAADTQPETQTCTDSSSIQQTPANVVITENERTDVYFKITNTGTCTWDKDYELRLISGDMAATVDRLYFKQTVYPGGDITLMLPVVAVGKTGNFSQTWQPVSSSGIYIRIDNTPTAGWLMTVKIEKDEVIEPLQPEPEVDVDWNMTKITWIGLGKCPTPPFDPQFTLSLTSTEDRALTYDFELEGQQTYPSAKYVECHSPPSNNRYYREVEKLSPVTINGKFTNCDLTNYVTGTIKIRVYEKKTFSEVKLTESTVQFEHTCGKD